MVAIGKPWTIIAGKKYKGVIKVSGLLKCGENRSDRSINLCHNVTIQTTSRFPLKTLAGEKWYVWHRMREIEKEWAAIFLRAGTFEKIDSPLSISLGQCCLIFWTDLLINDLFIFKQRERWIRTRLCTWMVRPHIVGIWQSKIFIKAMSCGKKLTMMAKVPLADHACPISSRSQQLSQRCLLS